MDIDDFDDLISKSLADLYEQQRSRRIEIIRRMSDLQADEKVLEGGNKHQDNYKFDNRSGNGNGNGNAIAHTKKLMENDGGQIAINQGFDKLITSLRTAVANEYKLDKEATSYDNVARPTVKHDMV